MLAIETPSITCPTEELSVTNSGEIACTSMDSAAVPNVSVMLTLASWLTCNVRPVIVLVLKPDESATTVYWPIASPGMK
jgi:hypothetical protein